MVHQPAEIHLPRAKTLYGVVQCRYARRQAIHEWDKPLYIAKKFRRLYPCRSGTPPHPGLQTGDDPQGSVGAPSFLRRSKMNVQAFYETNLGSLEVGAYLHRAKDNLISVMHHVSLLEEAKTYNRQDSQMVTHSSTSRPVQCLCMAERTGCPVFTDLWSYVPGLLNNKSYSFRNGLGNRTH